MRFILLLLITFSSIAQADSLGFNLGFGQDTKPFYGVDYTFNKDLPYLDLSLFTNKEYLQPSVSLGLQIERVNIGIATALTNGNFSFGPEAGYTYNLNSLIYVKENNNFMWAPGSHFNYSATFSIGLNL